MIKELEGFSVRTHHWTPHKLFFKQIQWKLTSIKNSIQSIPSFIKRIFVYLPILWEDRDYDYMYLLKLMQFKLARMEQDHQKYSLHEGKEYIISQLQEVQKIIQKIHDDEYDLLEEQVLNEKYGSMIILEGATEHSDFVQISMTRTKCLDDLTLFEKEKEETYESYQKAEKARQKDYQRLWHLCSKHCQEWWN